jgi:poly(ADP-ribose) glycohydrolase ARH3
MKKNSLCLQFSGFMLQYNGFQKTIIYAISLGGDTDTIATMAGAIAGAHYGIQAIPGSWSEACEGIQDADHHARELHDLAGIGSLGSS